MGVPRCHRWRVEVEVVVNLSFGGKVPKKAKACRDRHPRLRGGPAAWRAETAYLPACRTRSDSVPGLIGVHLVEVVEFPLDPFRLGVAALLAVQL